MWAQMRLRASDRNCSAGAGLEHFDTINGVAVSVWFDPSTMLLASRLKAFLSPPVCATLALLSGCASTPVAHKDLLDFLDQPPVTREQVRAHLGEPHGTFENAHVYAYRLGHSEAGYWTQQRKGGWEGVTYDLILEFDDHDVVQKHSLVTVRTP